MVLLLATAAVLAVEKLVLPPRAAALSADRVILVRRPPLPSPAEVPAPRKSEDGFDGIISEFATQYRVEPALVKAVIRVESGFDPAAVSRRGARGLMQLMPPTARSHGVSDVHDPRENIRGGVRHLRSLLDRFRGNQRLAVAAYNAGRSTVARYRGLPPFRETRRYVGRVLEVPQRDPTQTAMLDFERNT